MDRSVGKIQFLGTMDVLRPSMQEVGGSIPISANPREMLLGIFHIGTVKPRFTGPLGGKELNPVNQEAWYIGVHFALIYT